MNRIEKNSKVWYEIQQTALLVAIMWLFISCQSMEVNDFKACLASAAVSACIGILRRSQSVDDGDRTFVRF